MQGVGYGTTIEYIHLHSNLDDAIEWAGGTANAKYIVSTNNDDDDIDFDEGYQGNIQYAIVVKNQQKAAPIGDNDPRAIEANTLGRHFVPETRATLSNITIIGGPVNAGESGVDIRGSASVAIFNSAVNGFDSGCIRIRDTDTDGDFRDDSLSFASLTNVLANCEGGIFRARDADEIENTIEDAFSIESAFAVNSEQVTVPSLFIESVENGSDFIFDETDYIGAVEPGTTAEEAWWAGWTLEGTLDEAITNNNAD